MVVKKIVDNDKFIVYQITNLINGKRYIGVHKTKNVNDSYMGSGKLIKSAIQKYGIENFNKEIILIFEDSEDMLQAEVQLILDLKPEYNLHEGGYGGWSYINSTRTYEQSKFYGSLSAGKMKKENNAFYKKMVKEKEKYDISPNFCITCKIKIEYSRRKSKYCSNGCITPSMLGKKHQDSTREKISKSLNDKYKSNRRLCECNQRINKNNKTGLCINCIKKTRFIDRDEVVRLREKEKKTYQEIARIFNVSHPKIMSIYKN